MPGGADKNIRRVAFFKQISEPRSDSAQLAAGLFIPLSSPPLRFHPWDRFSEYYARPDEARRLFVTQGFQPIRCQFRQRAEIWVLAARSAFAKNFRQTKCKRAVGVSAVAVLVGKLLLLACFENDR